MISKTMLLLSRETLTELEAHLHKLEEDHKNKQLALSLDTRFVNLIIVFRWELEIKILLVSNIFG